MTVTSTSLFGGKGDSDSDIAADNGRIDLCRQLTRRQHASTTEVDPANPPFQLVQRSRSLMTQQLLFEHRSGTPTSFLSLGGDYCKTAQQRRKLRVERLRGFD